MSITWFNEKPKVGIATITAGQITLNKPATTFFETTYMIMLGIDTDKKRFIIKPLSKADALRNDIPSTSKYRITVKSSYSRITNKSFVEELSQLTKADYNNGTYKYHALWDENQQYLVINLEKEVEL